MKQSPDELTSAERRRNRLVKRDGFERLCLQLIENDELAGQAATPAEIIDFAAEAATEATAHTPARSKRILIADDDRSLRRVLGKILTAAG